MKSIAKLIFIALAIMLPAVSFGQKDVTKFLGIPVDGTKSEMIRKLQAKGFKLVNDPYSDEKYLEGEFNGEDVNVYVVTNNDKVYRICVIDKTLRDETDIRIRFNKLVRQFAFNDKYSCGSESFVDFIISSDEDINYGITVLNKRYSASFFQNITDSIAYTKEIEEIFSKFSMEDINNYIEYLNHSKSSSLSNSSHDGFNSTNPTFMEMELLMSQYIYRRSVWFMINKTLGKYQILLYYDNGYNQANGEDL